MNNFFQIAQQFQQFRQSVTPEGAKAKIQEMLNSGQMTQEQFNNLSKQAQSIMSMIKR